MEFQGRISLLLPRLPKLPNQYYSNRPGNLGDLCGNKEIQPKYHFSSITICLNFDL